MPTYEYECQKCGHRFEEFQSMKDAPLSKCPQCRGKVKRLIGAGAGLLFKGSGFYTTDYRSAGYSEKKKKDTGPPAAAGSGEKKGGGGEKPGGTGEKSGGTPAPAKPAPAAGKEPGGRKKSPD